MATVTTLSKNGSDTAITCLVCQRQCRLKAGQVGFCQTRQNQAEKIVSLTYGLLSGPPQADPVEKKPLYHFLPGTKTYSIGSFGCNFRCKKCLNWWCSWGEPAGELLASLAQKKTAFRFFRLKPQQVVERARQAGLPSIAFTYNEPTIGAEYVHDTARLAKKAGLKTIFVTNGSWTRQTIDYLGPYLDAVNIDFKAFREETAKKIGSFFKEIPAAARYTQKHHLHVEITTVLIPTINDSPLELKKMTGWIVKNLGPTTPWHLSAFSPRISPDRQFQRLLAPTTAQLKKAAAIGTEAGLKHVYVWAPNTNFSLSNTTCPHCGQLIVSRRGWRPTIVGLSTTGTCTSCDQRQNFVLE